MNKNIFEISDSEKGRILELHKFATDNHYLIYEQNPPNPTPIPVYNEVKTETSSTFPKQNLNNLFPVGAYYSDKLGPYVEDLKPSIDKFIKESGYSKFKLNITAGESRITNQEEFKTPGSLALKRAQTLASYFKKTFKDYIEKGILVITEPQSIQDVSIGTTEYIKGSASPESKSHKTYLQRLPNYKKEQFVNFELTGEGKSVQTSYICSYNENAKGGFARPDNNFIFLERNLDISKLPDGQMIEIKLTSYRVPDLLLVTTGGKQYSTGWVSEGASKPDLMAFATIVGNTYGNNPPYPFPKGFVEISAEEAYELFKSFGYKFTNMGKEYFSHVLKNVDFSKEKNYKKVKWFNYPQKANPFQMSTTGRHAPSKDPNTGGVINTQGQLLNYGGQGGKDIYITKNSSMTDLNIKVYSPIGTTEFRLDAKCF